MSTKKGLIISFVVDKKSTHTVIISVMQDDNLINAIHVGELPILGVKIPCAVLEDNRRVLTQEGYLEAIGRARKAKGRQGSKSDVVPFLAAKNLQPFISEELRIATKPIIFRHVFGGQAFGYSAETLPMVCDVYIDAQNAGALNLKQMPIAEQCRILKSALSQTGIIALVDEATGYQFHRAKDALQKIFEEFIAKDLRKWTKVFPDEFYRHLFRLRGLTYNEATSKRPSILAMDTVDFVYERLAPGVLSELRRLTPKDSKGRRKHKYHQRLTSEVGEPRLREHLLILTALMRSSVDREDFLRRLDLALPKLSTQHLLPGTEPIY